MMQAVAVDFWQYTAIHGLHVRGHPPCFTSRRRQLAKCYSCSTVFVTLLRCLLAAFIVVKNVFCFVLNFSITLFNVSYSMYVFFIFETFIILTWPKEPKDKCSFVNLFFIR